MILLTIRDLDHVRPVRAWSRSPAGTGARRPTGREHLRWGRRGRGRRAGKRAHGRADRQDKAKTPGQGGHTEIGPSPARRNDSRPGELAMMSKDRRPIGVAAGVLALVGTAVLSGCGLLGLNRTSSAELSEWFTVTSPVFRDGLELPTRYGCTTYPGGTGKTPPLRWSGTPAGTRSFAIVMDDPDADTGAYVHWVVGGIDGTTQLLGEGAQLDNKVEGLNTRRWATRRPARPGARSIGTASPSTHWTPRSRSAPGRRCRTRWAPSPSTRWAGDGSPGSSEASSRRDRGRRASPRGPRAGAAANPSGGRAERGRADVPVRTSAPGWPIGARRVRVDVREGCDNGHCGRPGPV
jgi:hypothetical protein